MFNFDDFDSNTVYITESGLEQQILNHQVLSLLDMLEMSYFEDGEDEKTKQKNTGIVNKIVDKILSMIKKIGDVFTGIKEGLKVVFTNDKKRLHADEYMSADSTNEKLNRELIAMMDEVDAEYRAAEPLLMNVSKILKMDPADLERKCDALNELANKTYDDNKELIHKGSKQFARNFTLSMVGNNLAKKSEKLQKFNKEAEQYTSELKKRQMSDLEKKNLNKLDKVVNANSKLIHKWYRMTNKLAALSKPLKEVGNAAASAVKS